MWKERTVERMAQTATLLPQRPGAPSVEIDGFLKEKTDGLHTNIFCPGPASPF